MRQASILLLASLGFAGGIAASSANAEVGEVIPATIGPTAIATWAGNPLSVSGHVFTFQVMIDACPALLKLDHTRLVEKPRVGTQKGAAVVTAYTREPEHVVTRRPRPLND